MTTAATGVHHPVFARIYARISRGWGQRAGGAEPLAAPRAAHRTGSVEALTLPRRSTGGDDLVELVVLAEVRPRSPITHRFDQVAKETALDAAIQEALT